MKIITNEQLNKFATGFIDTVVDRMPRRKHEKPLQHDVHLWTQSNAENASATNRTWELYAMKSMMGTTHNWIIIVLRKVFARSVSADRLQQLSHHPLAIHLLPNAMRQIFCSEMFLVVSALFSRILSPNNLSTASKHFMWKRAARFRKQLISILFRRWF